MYEDVNVCICVIHAYMCLYLLLRLSLLLSLVRIQIPIILRAVKGPSFSYSGPSQSYLRERRGGNSNFGGFTPLSLFISFEQMNLYRYNDQLARAKL